MVLVKKSKKWTLGTKIYDWFSALVSTLLLLWLFQDISSNPDTFMNTVRTFFCAFQIFYQTWHIYEFSEYVLWRFKFSTKPDTFMNTVSTLSWDFKFSTRPDQLRIQWVRYSDVSRFPPDLTHLQLVRYSGVSSVPPDLIHLLL